MKTIEEKAKIAYQIEVTENGCNAGETFAVLMYSRGILDAQQWISVEDELPEIKDKPYQVLVKSITGHMETYHVIDRKSQHFIKEFIEWRLIELL